MMMAGEFGGDDYEFSFGFRGIRRVFMDMDFLFLFPSWSRVCLKIIKIVYFNQSVGSTC